LIQLLDRPILILNLPSPINLAPLPRCNLALTFAVVDDTEVERTPYGLIDLVATWAKQGQLTRAAALLTTALESPVTPLLYKDIGRPVLAEIKAEPPPEVFAALQEEAKAQTLTDAVEQLRKEGLLLPSLSL
jgi:hypothetical protein